MKDELALLGVMEIIIAFSFVYLFSTSSQTVKDLYFFFSVLAVLPGIFLILASLTFEEETERD